LDCLGGIRWLIETGEWATLPARRSLFRSSAITAQEPPPDGLRTQCKLLCSVTGAKSEQEGPAEAEDPYGARYGIQRVGELALTPTEVESLLGPIDILLERAVL